MRAVNTRVLPEPAPASTSNGPPWWTVAGARGSRLGQDACVDGPHCPPDSGARPGALAHLRGDLYQQGGGGDAGPGRDLARCRSARPVDWDVPLPVRAAVAA